MSSVKVFCRVCPSKFAAEKDFHCSEDTIQLFGKLYTFDKVFSPEASQLEVYNDAAKPVVDDVLNGYNRTIFAYGATSSGKTHTIQGNLSCTETMGVIPRIASDIFNVVQSSKDTHFTIKVSCVEIYLEKIKDLLCENKKQLEIRESKDGVYIFGVNDVEVHNLEDVMRELMTGSNNRKIMATAANIQSSRSHCIFQMHIEQLNKETDERLISKLLLIDLAGSEKVSQTQCVNLDESNFINKSLTELRRVIMSLSKNKKHIPYRNSTLTRLLKDSLGGNCRTNILLCVSPDSEIQAERTLEFGCSAKGVRNKAVVNNKTKINKWRNMLSIARGALKKAESEIKRMRNGEHVPKEDQICLVNDSDSEIYTDTDFYACNEALKKRVQVLEREQVVKDKEIKNLKTENANYKTQQLKDQEKIKKLTDQLERVLTDTLDTSERHMKIYSELSRLTDTRMIMAEELPEVLDQDKDCAMQDSGTCCDTSGVKLSNETLLLEEYSDLLVENSTISEKYSTLFQEFSDLTEEKAKHTFEFWKLSDKHAVLSKEHSELSERYSKTLHNYTQLSAENSGLLEAHNKLLDDCSELCDKYSNLSIEMSNVKQENDELKQKQSQHKSEIKDLVQENEALVALFSLCRVVTNLPQFSNLQKNSHSHSM